VIIAVPILGAAAGLVLRSNPYALKVSLLLVTGITLLLIGLSSGALAMGAGGAVLLSLLPLTAFVTLLGQPEHPDLSTAWIQTLLLLGLGLGVVACDAPLSLIFSLLLLALVGLMLFYFRHQPGLDTRWALGTIALGILGVLIAMTTAPPVSSIALAVACAVVLPLVPFHTSYVAALTALPGNLPAFLALLLPVVGFHELLTVLPQFPTGPSETTAIMALVGTLYGSLKALGQTRVAPVAAYGSLAFFSILWWYLLTTRTAVFPTVVYLGGVGLATSGLLLAWYALRARYGDIGIRTLGGLASTMPRFSVGLSLLTIAALGLPPFGVFSGFIGMLLAPSFAWSGGLIVILLAWLAASWYLFDLVQELLFGRRQAEWDKDLRTPELASLVIVLVLLVALGAMPSGLFDPMAAGPSQTAGTEFPAWTK
jgi:NADH-quinone oxidoreductase subunit M